MITRKRIKDLYFFHPKSKIKAGKGNDMGKFPFYTSSKSLQKRIDEQQFNTKAIVLGTGGRPSIHYASGIFAVSTDCLVLSSKQEELNIKYAYYYILTNKHLLSRGFKGAGLKHISKNYIENIEINYPELEIQNKIVAILDNVLSIKEKRQQSIFLYDELISSIFDEMFGDPYENPKEWNFKEFDNYIDYIGDIGSNGSNKVVSENLRMTDDEDYAIMVRTTNLRSNDFKNKVKYVSKETYDFFEKSKIFGGELIMNKIGSAGDLWIMPQLNRKVSLGLNQLVIRSTDINQTFLYYYLTSEYGKTIIKSRIRGAAVKSITKTAVRSLPILSPPMNLQNSFDLRISIIKKAKDKEEKSIQKVKTLFESLAQLAFEGKLEFNTAVDLEVLMEKDYDFFMNNSNKESIKLLLDRLDKRELNSNKFYDQELYDKAKGFVFKLLNEKKIRQIYDDGTKKIKLSVE